MARARNIKPAFFNNDLLAEIEPLGRLFFIGLWTISDYRGCLEWRPKRLKAQLLPYDNCDVDNIGINLDKSGFIRFYSVQGQTFAKIVNFDKHQNPHKNEKSKGSDIPSFEEKYAVTQSEKGVRIKSDNIAINPDNNGSDPADSLLLIPDSPILIPETLCKDKDLSPTVTTQVKSTRFVIPDLQEVMNYFIEKTGDQEFSSRESSNFWFFYDSKGWIVGKTKMKSWKSSVSRWINSNKNKNTQPRYAAKPVIDNNDTTWIQQVNNEDIF